MLTFLIHIELSVIFLSCFISCFNYHYCPISFQLSFHIMFQLSYHLLNHYCYCPVSYHVSNIYISCFNSAVTNDKFKEGHDPEWLKKRTNNQFFIKTHDIFTTPVSFAHIAAMSRPGSDRSGPRPRLRRNFGVTGLRRDRDFEKRVSRHDVSRDIHLWWRRIQIRVPL